MSSRPEPVGLWLVLFNSNKPPLDRYRCRLGPVSRSQFLEETDDVITRGVLADAELLGDLFVFQALRDELEYFVFP